MKKIIALVAVFTLIFSFMSFAAEELEDATVEISTMAATGGKVYWGTKNWSSTTGYEAQRGTEFNLEARETSGIFLYWKDVKTSKILSTEKEYSFVALDDVNIQAMFAYKTVLATSGYVTFTDKDGTILWANYVKDGESANNPTTLGLKSAGYKYSGWSTDEWESVSAGDILHVTAVYEKNEFLYDVSITGGVPVPIKENYEYDDFVTVFADESAVPEGKYFAGWKLNGELVTEEEVYSFYVGTDCELQPVYADEEVEAEPVCAIIDVDSDLLNNRVSVLITRDVPEEYKLIESGILHADSSYSGDLVYGGKSVQKAVALSKEPESTFRFNLNMTSGMSKVARGYVVYEYEDTVYVCYSKQVTLTK